MNSLFNFLPTGFALINLQGKIKITFDFTMKKLNRYE